MSAVHNCSQQRRHPPLGNSEGPLTSEQTRSPVATQTLVAVDVGKGVHKDL